MRTPYFSVQLNDRCRGLGAERGISLFGKHTLLVLGPYDPCSGLAEVLDFSRVFGTIVIGKVGLNISGWFTLGFDYAGNGFGPSTGCASPSCKSRVFLKNELPGCHEYKFLHVSSRTQRATHFGMTDKLGGGSSRLPFLALGAGFTQPCPEPWLRGSSRCQP
jgi:hypothetical protein